MWRELPLGQLAEITSGGTPSREVNAYWGGDIPWVTPTDITACKTNYLIDTADRITKKGLLNSSAKVLPVGAILFTSRATVGVSRIAGMPVCTNQGFKSLIARPDVDGKFLFYQVQRQRGAFERYAAGSTFPEINKKDTARVLIPHPVEKKIQEKIAAVLTSIDTAIEKTEALIAKYQQIKAGLMHDLFTRGALPNGQLRPPREQTPELYRETAIGWIPRGWEISDCATEFAIDSGITLGPHRKPDKRPHPYLRVANVHRDELRLDDIAQMEVSASEIDFCLKKHDLLVIEGHANRSEIGRCAMVFDDAEGMLFQNHLIRLRPSRMKSHYALLWMNSHYAQRYWEVTCSSSSGLNTINRRMLGRLTVFVPPIDEQQKIVDKALSVKQMLHSERTTVQKLQTQKLGLMQDLLTGKVQVKLSEPFQEPLHA